MDVSNKCATETMVIVSYASGNWHFAKKLHAASVDVNDFPFSVAISSPIFSQANFKMRLGNNTGSFAKRCPLKQRVIPGDPKAVKIRLLRSANEA